MSGDFDLDAGQHHGKIFGQHQKLRALEPGFGGEAVDPGKEEFEIGGVG